LKYAISFEATLSKEGKLMLALQYTRNWRNIYKRKAIGIPVNAGVTLVGDTT